MMKSVPRPFAFAASLRLFVFTLLLALGSQWAFAQAPTITSFTPTSYYVGQPSVNVTVYGTNLTGATSAIWNGQTTTQITVVSSTCIEGVIPAANMLAPASSTISVTTPSGTATSSAPFVVYAGPTITSFTPTSGPGGTVVTINGQQLSSPTQVYFGGTATTSFTAGSGTSLTATVPPGIGSCAIVVDTPNGNAVSPTNFNVTGVPSAPTLTATGSATPSQVALSWSASSGASGYNIYRGTASGGELPTPIASNVSGLAYTDTSVTADTLYYYEAAAVNGTGVGGMSNQASALPGLPPAPFGLTAQSSSYGGIGLTWNAVPNAATYSVYRGTSSGGESGTAIASVGASSTGYTDSSVTSGTTYYYKVAAATANGGGAQSNEASALDGSSGPPAPSELNAVGETGQVALIWSPVSGAVGYVLYRGTAVNTHGAAGPLSLIQSGLTGTTYTDTGVVNGQLYQYKVAAVSANGLGFLSNSAYATPGTTQPAGPIGLTVRYSVGYLILSWTAVTGANGYNVYRGTSSGGEGTVPIASTSSSTVTYSDGSIVGGTTYYYEVTADTASGESARSNEASGSETAPLSAPTTLVATPGATQITLNWTTVPAATSYNIFRTTATTASTYLASSSTPSYVDTAVTSGAWYGYTVNAVDAAGQSGSSPYATATVGSNVLGAPTGLTVTVVHGAALLDLAWNSVAGAVYYDVYRSTSSGGEGAVPYIMGVTASTASIKTYNDSSVTSGTTYYYKVAARGNSLTDYGEGPTSNEASGTAAASPPAAPSGISAVPGTGEITVNWTAVSGATGYNLYRSVGTSSLSATAYQVGLSGTTYPASRTPTTSPRRTRAGRAHRAAQRPPRSPRTRLRLRPASPPRRRPARPRPSA